MEGGKREKNKRRTCRVIECGEREGRIGGVIELMGAREKGKDSGKKY